jgi:hypothetical protein
VCFLSTKHTYMLEKARKIITAIIIKAGHKNKIKAYKNK